MNVLVRWAAIAAMLSLGAPAIADDAPPPSPDGISWGAMGPWGSSSRNVWVGSDGRVVISSYQQPPPPAPCPQPGPGEAAKCAPPRKGTTTIRFSIGTAGFAEIRAILAPLEKKAGRQGKQCPIYDAGNASIGWKFAGKQTGYALGFACDQRQNQWADGLADAAEKRLNALRFKATDFMQVSE